MIDSASREGAQVHDFVVMPNRRRATAWAALFGVLAAAASIRAVAAHSTAEFVLALVFFGGPFAWWARWAWRRRPVLTITAHALIDGRSGRTVPWDSVIDARVGIERGLFGTAHHLVLTLANRESTPRRFIMTNANNPDEIDLNLDQLSATWTEVAHSVETASGYSVSAVCERA